MSNALRTAIGWVVVVILFIVAILLFRANVQRALRTGPGGVGNPARDVALLALDNKHTRLSAHLGHPLWVNFFATWCVPCKAELPEIEKRYLREKARGLEVLGIDEQEERALVVPFVKKMHMTYPVTIDNTGAATELYHVSAIPTSIFIGADGRIKAAHIGEMDGDMMDEALKKIL